jgi:glycosyltransferase involved in cell wall biosynthesis
VSPLRVLHLIPGNLYGGVETFIALTARRRDLSPGLEHHYAICFEGRLAEELEATGVPVHRLGSMRASRPWTVLRGRRRLQRLLSQNAYGVALTHSSWPHAMFASVLEKARVPAVFYLHGPINDVIWLDRWAGRHRPATLIAVSEDTSRTSRLLFDDVPTRILNYPIPSAHFDQGPAVRKEVRAELGAAEGDVILLQASRADRWKGHDRLFDALALLRDVPSWTLWLAGGAQRPKEQVFLSELKAQAQRLGIAGRIRFLGERRDVPRLLAGADIYCQANVSGEGFSLVFMEAFAAGRPIVTTRLGGAPELIDESSGVLVPAFDAPAFASALRELVLNGERRAKLGENAQKRVWSVCDPARRLGDLQSILSDVALGSGGRAGAPSAVSTG